MNKVWRNRALLAIGIAIIALALSVVSIENNLKALLVPQQSTLTRWGYTIEEGVEGLDIYYIGWKKSPFLGRTTLRIVFHLRDISFEDLPWHVELTPSGYAIIEKPLEWEPPATPIAKRALLVVKAHAKNIPDGTGEHTTLGELGITDEDMPTLIAALSKEFEIEVPPKQFDEETSLAGIMDFFVYKLAKFRDDIKNPAWNYAKYYYYAHVEKAHFVPGEMERATSALIGLKARFEQWRMCELVRLASQAAIADSETGDTLDEKPWMAIEMWQLWIDEPQEKPIITSQGCSYGKAADPYLIGFTWVFRWGFEVRRNEYDAGGLFLPRYGWPFMERIAALGPREYTPEMFGGDTKHHRIMRDRPWQLVPYAGEFNHPWKCEWCGQ